LQNSRDNSDFAALLAGCQGKIKYIPALGSNKDADLKDLLGLTTPNTKITKSNPQIIFIYLNSLEFRVLRATDPANYFRLLQEAIVHETIHAYIKINGTTNTLNLGDDPNASNNKDTGFGSLAEWMADRYGKLNDANRKVLEAHRGKYQGKFLDINPNSQAFIKKIVP